MIDRRHGVWAPLLLVATGCLSGGYEQQYKTAVSRHRSDSQFTRLHAQPVTAAGGRVAVRVPRVFTGQVDPATPPPRGRPAFLPDVPGFQTGFEHAAAAGAAPAVLALGVVSKAERRREDVEAAILQQVRADPSRQGAQWGQLREETSRTGQVGRWKVLEVAGLGEVWVSANEEQEFCSVLAWQVPPDAAAVVPLAELAPLVARTLEVLPPPAVDPAAGGAPAAGSPPGAGGPPPAP